MHVLPALKQACLEALDIDDQTPSDMALFYSVVNPRSVLEMIQMIEETKPPSEERILEAFDPIVDLIAKNVYPFRGTDPLQRENHYRFVRSALRLTNKSLAGEIERALRDYFDEDAPSASPPSSVLC